MITMTEIARLTNVSQPTVSRVLNGNRSVDPEIRERVLACARTHDYQCNALAKGLQGNRTHLLGLLLTDINNSFFSDLASEIESQARERGYSIILFNSNHNPQRQRECIDVVRRYRVDGVLIVPVLHDMALWEEGMKRLDVPAVIVTRRVKNCDCVYLDHRAAARQVARCLVECGYRRFLFVGKRSDAKFEGFAQELESLGMGPMGEEDVFMLEEDSAFLEAMRGWVDRSGPRMGIFANNDLWALRTLRPLRELGVRIPEEAGVIGFDNISMDRYLQPSLSSVSQPIARMAEEAVTWLLRRIDHPDGTDRMDLPLQADLVLRESTGTG